MTPEEKRALNAYINATEKRVARWWSQAKQEAFREATRFTPPRPPEKQTPADGAPSE